MQNVVEREREGDNIRLNVAHVHFGRLFVGCSNACAVTTVPHAKMQRCMSRRQVHMLLSLSLLHLQYLCMIPYVCMHAM